MGVFRVDRNSHNVSKNSDQYVSKNDDKSLFFNGLRDVSRKKIGGFHKAAGIR